MYDNEHAEALARRSPRRLRRACFPLVRRRARGRVGRVGRLRGVRLLAGAALLAELPLRILLHRPGISRPLLDRGGRRGDRGRARGAGGRPRLVPGSRLGRPVVGGRPRGGRGRNSAHRGRVRDACSGDLDNGEARAERRQRGDRRAVLGVRPAHDRRARPLAMAIKYTPEKQQELMETSLRNVRALVDEIEAEEAASRREQRRVFMALGAVVVALILVVGYFAVRKSGGTTVTVTPASAPAQP